MIVINCVLFSRLIKSDVLRSSKYVTSKKEKYSAVANGNGVVLSNNNIHDSDSLNQTYTADTEKKRD